VVKKVVRAGAEPVSQTYISFTGPFQHSPAEQYRLAALAEVLRNRLHDKLREALSGTYGVSVNAGGGRDEPATYSAIIRFGSAPERAEELSNAVLAEIRLMQEEGPPAVDVTKVQEAQRRGSELNLKQNAFWLSNLSTAYQYGDDPADILKQQQLFETLTPEIVRDAARRYLRLDNYVHITLQPQPPRT
jgi:zinc protease